MPAADVVRNHHAVRRSSTNCCDLSGRQPKNVPPLQLIAQNQIRRFAGVGRNVPVGIRGHGEFRTVEAVVGDSQQGATYVDSQHVRMSAAKPARVSQPDWESQGSIIVGGERRRLNTRGKEEVSPNGINPLREFCSPRCPGFPPTFRQLPEDCQVPGRELARSAEKGRQTFHTRAQRGSPKPLA